VAVRDTFNSPAQPRASSNIGAGPSDWLAPGVGCIYSFVLRNVKLATHVGRMASLVDWRLGEAE